MAYIKKNKRPVKKPMDIDKAAGVMKEEDFKKYQDNGTRIVKEF